MEIKDKLARGVYMALMALLAAAFFVPWISINGGADEVLTEYVFYSPWRLALGAGFPYNAPHPLVFFLLVIPLVLIILCLIKLPYKYLLPKTAAGLLAVTVFNAYFDFGMDFRNYAASTPLFWVVICMYVAAMGVLIMRMKAAKTIGAVENVSPPYNATQKMTIAGLLLACGVIIGMFRIPLPFAGVNLVDINFSTTFHNIAAIILGPLAGGIMRALSDVLVHFIRPLGAFLWPVTVVAFLRGLTIGYVWLKVRRVPPKPFSIGYGVLFGALLLFGLANFITLQFFAESAYGQFLAPAFAGDGDTPARFVQFPNIISYGLVVVGIIGLVPQFVIRLITKKTGNTVFYERYLKLMVSVVLPGIFFTWLNTVVLMFTAFSQGAINNGGFMLLWMPRFFSDIITSLIMLYAMVVLMEVYEKAMKRKIVQG